MVNQTRFRVLTYHVDGVFPHAEMRVRIAGDSEVIDESIEPHVDRLRVVARHRVTPREARARARYRQVSSDIVEGGQNRGQKGIRVDDLDKNKDGKIDER